MPDTAAINRGTPTVTVLDNRGLPVRTLQFCRTQANGPADLRITHSTFCSAGRLQTQSDPRLSLANLTNLSLRSGLSGAPLRRTSVDDGDTWLFTDILGRVYWQADSTGIQTTYANDALGRPLTVSQAKGTDKPVVRERNYYGDSAPASLLSPTQAVIANLRGRPVWTGSSAGLQTYAAFSLTGLVLDSSQQLLRNADSEADWSGDDHQASTWQHWQATLQAIRYRSTLTRDAIGRRLTHTDTAGHSRRQRYDVAGMLIGQWLTLKGQAEQPILLNQSYNAAGQPLVQNQANGTTLSHGYEAQTRRLISSTLTRMKDGKRDVLQALSYSHDPVGNLLAVSDSSQATRWFRNQQIDAVSTYSYDSLYQLLNATGREMVNQKQPTTALPNALVPVPGDDSQYTAYSRQYSYDQAGNLTQLRHSAPKTGNQWTSNFLISKRSNRAVSSTQFPNATADSVDSLFDQLGNQTQLIPGQTLTWNTRRQLVQVHITAQQREYYGYAGSQRIVKVSEQADALRRTVIYLPELQLRTSDRDSQVRENLQVISLGGDNASVRALHWTAGKPDDVANDGIRYSYANALGSVQLELDQQGNIISREEYYPFGGTAIWAAKSQTEATYKVLRYSGQERDASGLYHFAHRYYQPWAARWLSADPAGPVDGLNLYVMVRNNPVSNRDEGGLRITVGNNKYKNDAAFKASPLYKTLLTTYPAEQLNRLVSHYNATDEVFHSDAHLTDLVAHDINSFLALDSLGEHQAAQRDYLSRTGWHSRLKSAAAKQFPISQRPQAFWKAYKFAEPGTPLAHVDKALAGLAGSASIRVYRTMTHTEANEILVNHNYDALGKHLGDYSQALSYFHRSGDDKVLLEFPLKPGAHELLFTPEFSAVLDSGNVTSVMASLATGRNYSKARKGEGSLPGHIGIKPEEHGVSGFSLSLGDSDSKELFKRFTHVKNVREVQRR